MQNGSLDLGVLHAIVSNFGDLVYKNIWLTEIQLYDEEKVFNVCFNCTFMFHRLRRRG